MMIMAGWLADWLAVWIEWCNLNPSLCSNDDDDDGEWFFFGQKNCVNIFIIIIVCVPTNEEWANFFFWPFSRWWWWCLHKFHFDWNVSFFLSFLYGFSWNLINEKFLLLRYTCPMLLFNETKKKNKIFSS